MVEEINKTLHIILIVLWGLMLIGGIFISIFSIINIPDNVERLKMWATLGMSIIALASIGFFFYMNAKVKEKPKKFAWFFG